MGSKKRIAQYLTAVTGAVLLAVAGYTVHDLVAAPPTPPQAAAANRTPAAPGLGPGECSSKGRPAAGFFIPQSKTPWCWDVVAMDDAVPTKAYATPKKPRKILVLCKAAGFVHSSIPLAAAAIKEIGIRTGAWSTTITYDPADINAQNLRQYDMVFLASTTGQYLDDPNNKELTTERRQALLNFVRSGKGLAGVHAAVDSYHTTPSMAAFRRDRRLDPAQRHAAIAAAESFVPTGTWPAYNKMIGGFFKWHWPYPQVITVKIDDTNSPVNQMFHGQEFVIHDETYTMAQDSYSLRNVHELTSIDYPKMSQADKDKEPAASRRTDGDYGLSWIRREGKGRVFIDVLGHDEHMYENPVYLKHLLAGTQYALGDLQANDAPTER